MADLAILIPAAGASSRMRGADKLMEDIGGRPCLAHVVRRALQVSDTVYVCVPAIDHPRVTALAGMNVTLVVVQDAARGMSASLKAGIATLPSDVKAAMILPADMPDITGQDMTQLWAVFQASGVKILQASDKKGNAGHPVLFGSSLFAKFDTLSGDKGAQSIIKGNPKAYAMFPIQGQNALLDLDTPEDWAAWRSNL